MQTGLGGPGKTLNPFPPRACFSHTLLLPSLGPAVLTPSSPSTHSAQGALKPPPARPPPQSVALFEACSCVAWELGWELSPESTSAPTHFPCGSQRPPGTSTE